MTGMPTTCHDNDRLGRTGCEAHYSGNMAHCVAKAAWSEHDDGYCHATFSTPSVADMHWVRGVHTDPALVTKKGEPALRQDDRGVWRTAGDYPTIQREPRQHAPEATQTAEMGGDSQ